jgi:PAS domain S-box-containing protein
LEAGEYCRWIISDPLTTEEARDALRREVWDLDRRIENRDIDIVFDAHWYLKEDAFNMAGVIEKWDRRLGEALSRGHAGMRLSANTTMVQGINWSHFMQFMMKLDPLLAYKRLILLCTYPLATGAEHVLDLLRTHQMAAGRWDGRWEVIETQELKRLKQEMEQVNARLEQRVTERTEELSTINETLRREITEHKESERRLARSEEQLEKAQQLAHVGSWTWDLQSTMAIWSNEMFRIRGLDPQSEVITYDRILETVHPGDRERYEKIVRNTLATGEPFAFDFRVIRPNGAIRVVHNEGELIRDADGTAIRLFGTSQDVTERHEAERLLREHQEQLRALAHGLTTAREDEATRIARDIHDQLGQMLTGLKMDVKYLRAALAHPTGNTAEIPALRERLDGMADTIDRTADILHEICASLRPSVLDELGLVAALEWQARQFEERTAIFCNLSMPSGDVSVVDPAQAITVFRIFQEVLTNVARHANATEVDVSLEITGGLVTLKVTDNGRGITDAEMARKNALGVLGMRERALAGGGSIMIQGTPGQGTSVVLQLPAGMEVP